LREAIVQQVVPLLREPLGNSTIAANAERVLNDISQGKVFDDIIVEFDSILSTGFKSLGYSVD
jgi:hypothetical protein